MTEVLNTNRRKLLKGALATLGALGGMFALRESLLPKGASGSSLTLKLYGQHWHLYSRNREQGELPDRGDQAIMYGDLLNQPEGEKVGEFYANKLQLESSFSPSSFGIAGMEWHTFNLKDGTILGMGTAKASRGEDNAYVVVGGTGRFAGAKGSYLARQNPQETCGDGTAEFTLNLSL